MMFNLLNFLLGIVSGGLGFWGIELMDGSAITPSYAHLIFIPAFGLLTLLPYFRKRLSTETKKFKAMALSFISFSVGFFLPFLFWVVIVVGALSNALN